LGLVAKQVAKMNPDLVVSDREGKINIARYDAVKDVAQRVPKGTLQVQEMDKAMRISPRNLKSKLRKSKGERPARGG
jgi:hypothetical protein